MRHLFIVNPAAGGRKKKYKQTIADINTVMKDMDEPYEVYITRAPMDACDKIRDAAETCDELRVYACGGDGTLNECVNGAVNFPGVSVTHYPCGTGNDFIKTFGNDAEKFKDLHALIKGFAKPIDLIDCNGRYSINICSVGIDAEIGTDVHKYSRIPIIGGPTGYVISMFVNFIKGINRTLKIITEEGVQSGKFALVCACNGRYYGGGFNPVPEAIPDDGLIDFLIVNKVSRLKFLQVILKYAKGRYREIKDLTHILGKFIVIQSEKALVINVDGEAIYGKTLYFRVRPAGINFVFPENAEYLALQEANINEKE